MEVGAAYREKPIDREYFLDVRANDTTFHTSVMPGVYLGVRF